MTDPSAHRVLRESLGSYVLGHLSDQEAGEVRAHLTGCSDCRAELTEILPVAAELGIPVSTLRSRVFYGLKALRVIMDEMEVTS